MLDRNSLTEEQKQYVIDHALDGLTTYFTKETYKKNTKEYNQYDIDNIINCIMSKKNEENILRYETENGINFNLSLKTASYVSVKNIKTNYVSGKISNNELFNMHFKENILSAKDFIKIIRDNL